jgi:two-component system, NtrC family, sensor histidine kinase HydH
MKRSWLLLWSTGLVILVALAAWSVREGRRVRNEQFRELRSYSRATVRALVGSAQSDMRRGCLHRERFTAVLDQMVGTNELGFVILKQGGTQLVAAGQSPAIPGVAGPSGDKLERDWFIHWETVRIQDCGGRGPGRGGGWGAGRMGPGGGGGDSPGEEVQLGPDGQIIVLGLAAGQATARIAATWRRLAVMMGVGTLAVLAFMLAWAGMIRSRRLRAELSEAQAHAGFLEELHLVAAGLAHETRNPLGIIRGLAQQIAEGGAGAQDRERAQNIVEEADIASARLGDFLQYAKPRTPELAAVRVDEVFGRVASLLDSDAKARGATLAHSKSGAVVQADAGMLTQVLMNLLLNGLQAVEAGGRVELRCLASHGLVTIEVEDNGRGVAPELLPRIFQPYVSGRSNGHGIGLAIVKRIVDEHGWKIAVRSEPGKGTTVAISGVCLQESVP